MLTVVFFKWADRHHGYKGKFNSSHVNVMADRIDEYYPDPHRFVCFTDDPAGIDSRIETHALWDDYADIPNPTGGGRPSCYRRLKLWDPAIENILGKRFVHIDLDAVVCGDLRPLWNRKEDLVMWADPFQRWPYLGGTYLMNAGARPQVWEAFHPVKSPQLAAAKGYQGSDQAWISYCLGYGEAAWTQGDGLYRQLPGKLKQKPQDARIVFTTGRRPPWGIDIGWMREAYEN